MNNTSRGLYRYSWATLVLVTAAIAVAGYACKKRPDTVILQREWTANAEFAGDIWAMRVAPTYGIQLDVREGSETIDPVKMVRAGNAHFGVASADRILQENESGAGLIILGAATYRSPVIFLTKQELNIKTPAGFRGRTIGLQAGTNTELVFHALAQSQNLSLQDVKVVESGWGTQSFEVGTIDVLGAFAYDEPVSLEFKKVPFGMISPEDYGVRYVGTVYFTRKALIDEDPKLVQAFMNALFEGWQRALENPQEAIDLLSQRFETVRSNAEKEKRSLERGREFFAGEGGQLLAVSQTRWNEMAKSLVSLGKLKAFDFNKNVDYRFRETASDQLRKEARSR